VIFFWLALAIAFAYPAAGLIRKCQSQFPAPKHTDAYDANQMFSKKFPELKDTCTHIVYIQTNDGSNVTDHSTLDLFDRNFLQRLYTYEKGPSFTFQYASYWNFTRRNWTGSGQFISEMGTAAIIDVGVRANEVSNEIMDWSKWVQKQLDELNPDQDLFLIEVVGIGPLTLVAIEEATKNFESIDAMSIPLATLIFCGLLQTWRFVALPLVTMAIALCVSFGIVSILASSTGFVVCTITPNLMMCILIAMSFDYSLFLLVRFQEELRKGISVETAVEHSIITSGFTITISGWTMIVCFLSLFCFPISVISSLGAGAGISLFFVWLVNLTLFPGMLLSFPEFFKQATVPCICCRRKSSEDYFSYPLAEDEPQPEKGIWFDIARLQSKRFCSILVVLLISVGCGLLVHPTMQNETTDDINLLLPHESKETQAYTALGETFGMGSTVDLRLLVNAKPGRKICETSKEPIQCDAEYFYLNWLIVEAFANDAELYDTSKDNFLGVSYAQGNRIPHLAYELCFWPLVKNHAEKSCEEVLYEYDFFVNADNTASYTMIALNWDPLDYHMNDWYKRSLDLVDELRNSTGLEIHILGLPCDIQANVKVINDWFPVIIAVTCAGVLFIVGFFLQSLFIPLRSILSIAGTILFVFGMAKYIYTDGILNWTGIANFMNTNRGTQFLVPVSCFAIIIGISLDYDVFLVTRIREYRAEGKSTDEAIILGVGTTGHLITAAGVVMAAAFGGLLTSNIVTMAQFGFYLVSAVLFDTFVVRSFFVPSVMFLLGRFNWWPSHLSNLKYSERIGSTGDFLSEETSSRVEPAPTWTSMQSSPKI